MGQVPVKYHRRKAKDEEFERKGAWAQAVQIFLGPRLSKGRHSRVVLRKVQEEILQAIRAVA
jgi:hypothetical protein